jgi:undecaprenyl diphosphate synthase
MNNKIPVHLAIIPDGNRRWAKSKGLIASAGHKEAGSYGHMKDLFECARELGIKYLTFWGFSTENWKRDAREIDSIFELVSKAVKEWRKEAIDNKIRFRHIGRKDRLPKSLVSEFAKLEEETKNYLDFNVQICLDYGGRDEIVRAVNKIIESGEKNINENKFSEFLDTNGIPEPDLIIRTSGEKRTSGFMPFQSAYSELYFSDVHFPDFDACELEKAIAEFGKRKRNFGGN